MLQVFNVSCGYGRKPVLENLSFSAGEGEIICILGANGIGKTTLFKSILGHIRLISGQIWIDGDDVNQLKPAEKAKRIAYVPQAHIPPFPYKVFDVVVMGRTAHIKTFAQPSRHDLEIAREALRLVRIEALADRIYTEISGGERQLVLIARAIAQKSKLLILDEPMANLDYGNQLRIMEQFHGLSALGMTILYTTHNPEHAFLCSHQVLAIRNRKENVFNAAEMVITDQLLREIYHIEAEVKNISQGNRTVKVCIPYCSYETMPWDRRPVLNDE